MEKFKRRIPSLLLLLLLLALGSCLAPSLWMVIPAGAAWAICFRRNRLPGKVMGFVLIWFVMLEAAILSFMLGQTLSPGIPTGTETMVIPGAAILREAPGAMLQSRLDGAVPILAAYPDMIVIVSGGRSPEDLSSEARIMKEYLVREGISASRILEEDRARDTIGNLEYSGQMIAASGLSEKILLVTNEFHGFRGRAIAQANVLDPVNRSVHSSPGVLLKYLVREFASMIKVQLRYGAQLQWQGSPVIVLFSR